MKNSARFTERASGAIAAARDASASLGHSYVGTEHILLGIAREGEGLGAKVLRDKDASPVTQEEIEKEDEESGSPFDELDN